MSAEPAITDLLARIAELTRLLNTVQGEVRVLAAMPPAPARDRRLADLYREIDAIADEAARIGRLPWHHRLQTRGDQRRG